MLCHHCNAEMPEGSHFCPSCGRPVGVPPVQKSFWSSFWLKGLGVLALLGLLAFYAATHYFVSDVSVVVEQQLIDIKQNKLFEAYHGYTSKQFQASNSFEKFKEFILAFPLLQYFNTMKVGDPTIKGNLSTITVILQTPTEVDGELIYQLIKENNEWKILGMQLTEFQKTATEPTSATVELIAPVETQLKALQKKDFLGAYKDLVTKEFELQTPFEKFKAFIIANPILTTFQNYVYKEHYTDEDKGVVTVILDPDKEAYSVQYRLIREGGKWKILQLRLLIPAASTTHDASGMITIVRNQLEALAQNKVEEAYSQYLAKELQQKTSLNDFRNFIKHYPAFTTHTKVNITDPYFEEGIGRLSAELENDQGTTVVEYAVAKEGNLWKIVGMHVEKGPEVVPKSDLSDVKNFKTRDLMNVIQSFLASLREKDLSKAYEKFTSRQFQAENSLSTFEEFIKRHPEFIKNTSSNFDKLMFNNNIATFGGSLILPDGLTLPLEIDLIDNEGNWKILHILTMPAVKENQQKESFPAALAPLEMPKLVLGTQVNDDGVVQDPTLSFKPDSGDIYANLYIRNGKAGEALEILLRHMESGSTIPKVNATLLEDGESMITFIFSPPAKGWPKGNYQIKVSAPNNVAKTFAYVVE